MDISDNANCIICNVDIDEAPSRTLGYYPESGGWLCNSCREDEKKISNQPDWTVEYEKYHEQQSKGCNGCLGAAALFLACIYYGIKDLFGFDSI